MKVLHDWDNIKEGVDRRNYLDVLIQLDLLAGVTPVVGIRDEILCTYPDIFEQLKKRYGDKVEYHLHIHDGDDFTDDTRTRRWIPDLNQPMNTWHYDTDLFRDSKLVMLKKGELPIIHVDHVENLWEYVKYLYWIKFEGLKIYE